jgi:hypothetical protein
MWNRVGKDKGRWTKYVDSETGKSSIEEHELKLIWKSCKPGEHKFELSGNREVTCTKCQFVKPFILGQEVLKDGKLIPITKPF